LSKTVRYSVNRFVGILTRRVYRSIVDAFALVYITSARLNGTPNRVNIANDQYIFNLIRPTLIK